LHPEVQVEVQDLERAAIYERVQNGELDSGFGAFLSASSAVRRRRLLDSSLVLVSSAGFSKPTRWKDLHGLPLLRLPSDNPIQQLVESQVRSSASSAVFGPSFNHLHTLLAMVESGAGTAILPDFVTAAALRY
jgi:DNA-binding transcriptional LysR family regulator